MKRFTLLLFLLWSTLVLAQQKPQGIPTTYMNDPAIDLYKDGKSLMPDEVHKLREDSKGRFDISTLNPNDKTDLWKNVYVKDLPADLNPIMDLDEVNYHSPVLSPTGVFRFNIQNKNGDGKLYTMMLSKSVHSVLLAKSLLRKIGYQIPDVKYIPRVSIKFKDKNEKIAFISYLENVAFAGSAKYWIVDNSEDNKLILQDLIIMDANNVIYNLAVGVTDDMIQGRRLLSSLVVPLSIVNLTESVNLLRWNAGTINNKYITLLNDHADDFQCSWDDGRWGARRIEKLTREDWQDIVASTHMPKPVQMLLLEKLISRRNTMMKLFKIDAIQYDINNHVSSGVELVNGKLTQQFWPGYASRFAFGDPDSPLSDSEIRSFVKSKALTTALDVVVSQFDQLHFMGTDIQTINNTQFQAQIQTAINKSIATKTPVVVPLKAWHFPVLQGQLILSRNLITGTYLGTDNLVQLVDTVGASVSAGMFAGTMGLPTPLTAFGTAQGLLARTYSHIRPVTSIQKSLKYPFKNIFVPLVKMDYGRILHEATLTIIDPKATDKQKEDKITKALKPFKDALEVGESILVTDTLAASASAEVDGGYKQLFQASLGISTGDTVLSRFHVHRKSLDEFQVYKDLANVGSFSLAFGIDSLIPIFHIKSKSSHGNSRVKFFSINLSPKNPSVIKNASLLRGAIIHSTVGDIEANEETKPYILKHSYNEYTPSMDLLFWDWQKVSAGDDFNITTPDGDTHYYHRNYYGKTNGRNYQAYVTSMISHWVSILFKKKAGLSEGTGSNPGYSFKGRAETKFLTYDQEVDTNGKLIEPFIRLSRIWNGWSLDSVPAQQIIDEMKQTYRFEFYNAPVLNDTRHIFMYNLSVNLFIYRDGIDFFLALKDDKIKFIFQNYKSQKDLTINPAEVKEGDTKVARFLNLMKRYRKNLAKGHLDHANKLLLKALYLADDNLTMAGMSELVGGVGNLYMNSRIDGFREGDEDGDKPIQSSSLGEYGSKRLLGPIVDMQQKTHMLEGEFFIYWSMTRLI
jgi:hypothetical protein